MQASSNSSSSGPVRTNAKKISMAFGIFLTLVLFAIPLGLIYNFVFYKSVNYIGMKLVFLFIMSWLLGLIATLLYYRISLKNDANAQIDKINFGTVLNISGLTLAAYMVVAITLLLLFIAPSLVKIFENTLGYWFIGLWGLQNLCNQIFTSKLLDEYKDTTDSKYFNYGFLITRIDRDNVQSILEYAKKQDKSGKTGILPLDFDIQISDDTLANQLQNLVDMKYYFGHFSWLYLTSVISLFLSMISVSMAYTP